MKLDLKDPQTGRQVEVTLPEWKLLMGMMEAAASFRSLASVHALAGMLANPEFEPLREDGEDTPQAYARRAVDYGEALEAELQRREAANQTRNAENGTQSETVQQGGPGCEAYGKRGE